MIFEADDRYSTPGNLFVNAGGPVSWVSKNNYQLLLYDFNVALSMATQEAVWSRQFLQ